MGKPMESFTKKQFDFYYSQFVSLAEINITAFGKLQKSPECFSKEQFTLIENNLTMYSGFKRAITREFILKQPKPFLKITWETVYGTKL